MTRPSWTKLFAAAVGLAAVVALANPWPLAEKRVHAWAVKSLSGQTGLSVSGSGRAEIAFLPTPRIILKDVRAEAEGLRIETQRVRVDIRVLTLLAGRADISDVTLYAPQVSVAIGEDADLLSVLTSRALSDLPATPRLHVRENGSLFLRRGQQIVSLARNVRGSIAARQSGEPAQIEAQWLWRGEDIAVSFASDSATRAIQPMLALRSGPFALDFTGARRSGPADPGPLSGTFSLRSPSLSRLNTWLASGSPVLLPLGATTLAGQLILGPASAELKAAMVQIGNDQLQGALDWRKTDGRWRLGGTLAGRSLEIGGPNGSFDAQRFGPFDPASTIPLDVDDLFAHDIDLRLSLDRVRLPGLALTELAAQINGARNRLDLTIVNAGLHKGVLRARASLSRADGVVELKGQVSGDRVDLGALTADMLDTRRMTGTGSLQLQVDMAGRTGAELTSSAAGRLAFSARNGDFQGMNLNDAMRRIERQPLAAARDWRGGRTSFEQLIVNGQIRDGVLELGEARAVGAGYRLTLGGRLLFTDKLMQIAGTVQSPNGQIGVPFDIAGALLEPIINVNTRVLIERSGAASPFLQPRPN
jgi:AsmA protein